MACAFDEKEDAKWITIHPHGSEHGKHVMVNGEGEVVAGNPHLVAALKEKTQNTGVGVEVHNDEIPDDLGDFSPPSADDFGDDIFDNFTPPSEDDFSGVLDNISTPNIVYKKPLDFKNRTKDISLGSANAILKSFLKKIHSDPKTAPSDVLKGNKESREQGIRMMAVTLERMKEIIKPKILKSLKKIEFVPCTTKGANSSFSHTLWGDWGCFNIAPLSKEQHDLAVEHRKGLLSSGEEVWSAKSRYSPDDFNFMLASHEIAHGLYHINKLAGKWDLVVKKAISGGFDFRKKVSVYSWHKKDYHRRINEAHSECFAMMAHPDYKKGSLPKCIEDYFYCNVFADGIGED